MAIPATELFEQFIGKSRVVERPNGAATPLSMAVGQPTFYLEHPQTALTLDSVLRVISRELTEKGCAAPRNVAIAALAAIVSTIESGASPVEHANACLSQVHRCDVFQHVVLPSTCSRDYETLFGEFRIGPFDPEKLLYWGRRGGSTYPLDLNSLAGRTALERERFSTLLLNWDAMPVGAWRAAQARHEMLPQAVQDIYYAAVSNHHFREIPKLMRDRTRILEAGSLVHVDVESLFDSVFSQRLGLFRWQSDSGQQRTWAVLSTMGGFHVNLAPPELVARCRHWLKEEIGFVELHPSKPLDRTLDAFCGLLQRAHDHRLRQRPDEAALHFVIAIDFLLGSERRSTESVTERAAVIAHRPLGRPLEDSVRRIRQVYDARSKYVHEGRTIPATDILEAERVAMEVLWALLTVSGTGVLASTLEWLKKIDYVLAALRDGRVVADEDLQSIGIPKSGVARVPPNRVIPSAYEEG
jgi:hypothetical protein